MAGSLDLGNLLVHLRADDSAFNRVLGGAMRSLKRYAKYAAIAGAAQLTLSVKAYATFEKQLANVSTMLEEQTMRYMPSYEKALKSMAMEFGEGTDTLSKGLYDILSASVAPSKALNVLAASAKAAKAGLTTTAVAADAITTVLNSYGMAAEDSSKISDILFATVKRGKLTFAELAPNIGKVASIAATAGLTFEELSAAIATMTRAGLQADLATTALRSLMSSFIKPTDDAKEMAKQFGFELNSATLSSIGLTGVLKKLKGATAEQVAALIPNVRATAGFAAMLRQVEGAADDLKLMYNSLGLTQQAYEKMTDTLTHTFTRFWQSIKITSVQMGSYLAPAIREVTDRMTEWLGIHQQEIAKAFVGTIEIMVKAIEKLTRSLRLLPVFWTQFIVQTKKARLGIYAVIDSFADLVKAVPWLTNAVEGYGDEIDSLNKEIAGLQESMDEMIISFLKASPAVDDFFDNLVNKIDVIKWKLDWSIVWRDFNRGLTDVKDSMSPFVNLLDRMRGSIESVTGIDLAGMIADIGKQADEGRKKFGDFGTAIDLWQQRASNVWKRMGEVGSRSLDRISETLTELVMKGKADFASLTKAILADILQIQIRWQMAQMMTGLLPGLPWGSSAPTATETGAFTSPHGGHAVQRGGSIEKTGWAVVHKGEKFSGVNNEYNIGTKAPNVIINNNNANQAPIQQSNVSFDGNNVIVQIEAAINDRLQRGAGPLINTIKSMR